MPRDNQSFALCMTSVAQIPLTNTWVNPNTCVNAAKILAFMDTLTDSSLSLRNYAVQTTWKQEELQCRTWSLPLVDWANSAYISSGSGPCPEHSGCVTLKVHALLALSFWHRPGSLLFCNCCSSCLTPIWPASYRDSDCQITTVCCKSVVFTFRLHSQMGLSFSSHNSSERLKKTENWSDGYTWPM